MYFKLIYFFLMAFVCTSTGCVSEDDPQGVALQTGDRLPEFSVELNNGQTVSTSSLRGKTGVIVFFNTGCRDCREELPVIQQLWDEYKDNERVVIAVIAREESEEEIAAYWQENNLTMPYSPQENKDVYLLFAPSVIPRIFISNSENIITFTSDDSDMPSLSRLKEEIENITQ